MPREGTILMTALMDDNVKDYLERVHFFHDFDVKNIHASNFMEKPRTLQLIKVYCDVEDGYIVRRVKKTELWDNRDSPYPLPPWMFTDFYLNVPMPGYYCKFAIEGPDALKIVQLLHQGTINADNSGYRQLVSLHPELEGPGRYNIDDLKLGFGQLVCRWKTFWNGTAQYTISGDPSPTFDASKAEPHFSREFLIALGLWQFATPGRAVSLLRCWHRPLLPEHDNNTQDHNNEGDDGNHNTENHNNHRDNDDNDGDSDGNDDDNDENDART